MRRIIMALVAGGVLAGAVYGAAASLGNLTGQNIAASDANVVSCNTLNVPLPVSYLTELNDQWLPPRQVITQASVTFPLTCAGESIRLRLVWDTDGMGPAEPTILFDGTSVVDAAGLATWTTPPPTNVAIDMVTSFHLAQVSAPAPPPLP